jgi:hypothetical protein
MKKCMSGCGGNMMSKGGKVTPKKMKSGGIAKQTIVGGPGYNALTSTMKMGGSASLPKCTGGDVRMPDGSCGKRKTTFKKGGNVSKLAKLAPPTNKVTRADVIAGALKNKRKKK